VPGGTPFHINGVAAAPGTVVPNGTALDGNGIRLVLPDTSWYPLAGGNQTLTRDLRLPAQGTVAIPQHAASLALVGRDTLSAPTYYGKIRDLVPAFVPNGNNAWEYLNFTRGVGHAAVFEGARRPAFVIVDVNNDGQWGGAPAQRLLPITVYHAPSAGGASTVGMERSSFIRPLYQTFDPQANAWIDGARAVIGGDYNVPLLTVQFPYAAYGETFGNRGANCQILVNARSGITPPEDVVANRSMVLIQTLAGDKIFSPDRDTYRQRAIDNVFFRGFANGTVILANPVGDLLAAVAGQLPQYLIQRFLAIPVFRDELHYLSIRDQRPPPPATPAISVLSSLVLDMFAGMFTQNGWFNDTPARRGAEFVNLCVSDHLPVLFSATL
jgi:hypothetical protein